MHVLPLPRKECHIILVSGNVSANEKVFDAMREMDNFTFLFRFGIFIIIGAPHRVTLREYTDA